MIHGVIAGKGIWVTHIDILEFLRDKYPDQLIAYGDDYEYDFTDYIEDGDINKLCMEDSIFFCYFDQFNIDLGDYGLYCLPEHIMGKKTICHDGMGGWSWNVLSVLPRKRQNLSGNLERMNSCAGVIGKAVLLDPMDPKDLIKNAKKLKKIHKAGLPDLNEYFDRNAEEFFFDDDCDCCS